MLYSSFSSTKEQFSLADVWLRGNALVPSNLDSAPLLPSASTRFPLSKGARVDRSMASKGAQNVNFSPSDSPFASKGDSPLPLCTPD